MPEQMLIARACALGKVATVAGDMTPGCAQASVRTCRGALPLPVRVVTMAPKKYSLLLWYVAMKSCSGTRMCSWDSACKQAYAYTRQQDDSAWLLSPAVG